MRTERIVEAELFSAAKPVTVTDLQTASGLDARTIRGALKRLMDEYNGSDRAIEIAKMGPRYAMQVKKEYSTQAGRLAELKVPKDVLKTASLIAYYQPVLQSKMFDLVGAKIYDHVKQLVDLGLVKARPKRKSVELTTTKRFIETFGIDARSRQDVKAWLEEQAAKLSGKSPRT
ncbi:MAG: SMC-Scp complex subunit ScpB [Candidatus Thermoplasmatota archaeon]|nr:SMC-Scp complex subunit ScpB [Candidatus Thermoplasmatota archaeon]